MMKPIGDVSSGTKLERFAVTPGSQGSCDPEATVSYHAKLGNLQTLYCWATFSTGGVW